MSDTTPEELDRLRYMSELLRLAAHDLRAPLALIVEYCDLISLESEGQTENLPQYVDIIRGSARRMRRLVDTLLRVVQAQASPVDQREQVILLELTLKAVENAHVFANSKNLRIETQITLGLDDTLLVDPVLIGEAMDNLVSNAVKYTPPGGRVAIGARIEDGRFHFVVEDTGIGIEPEALPHLFDPFYRVRQPATEGIEGTGLGLSLVKAAVERHGGGVWVESEAGKGSRFGFWLPQVTPSPEKGKHHAAAGATAGEKDQ
jgi:signal transduction histidine kinase